MSQFLLIVVTFIYAAIAASRVAARDYGMAITFAGYCAANIGLLMSMK